MLNDAQTPVNRCAGKIGYKNEGLARRALREVSGQRRPKHRRKGLRDQATLRAYPCPDCGAYHIGHAPKRLKP